MSCVKNMISQVSVGLWVVIMWKILNNPFNKRNFVSLNVKM